MENLYAFDLRRVFQPHDSFTCLERAWVPARSHHYADRSIRRPAEVAFADTPFYRGFQRLDQVTLKSHQHRLGFRITEAAVELEHHRPTCGHHEPAIEDTSVFDTLGLNAGDDGTRDMGN